MNVQANNPQVARPPRGRRSFVIIAVLVICAAAILMTTALLFTLETHMTVAAQTRDATQLDLLARSGVSAIMTELDQQRDRILAGERPELTDRYVLYETETGSAVVDLVLQPGEWLAAAEAGRLDLAFVDAAALEATGVVDAGIAAAIIEYRDQTLGRPFQSVAELLSVPGVAPILLYGPSDGWTDMTLGQEPRGLADLVTVYGWGPPLTRAGALREDVPTDEEGEPVTYETMVAGLIATDPDNLAERLDEVRRESGDLAFGLIDVNSAPAGVLQTIFDEETAAAIVGHRDNVDPEIRWSTTWLLTEGLVGPELFAANAVRLTTRCWTWRVRFAVGELTDEEDELNQPMVVEAVIDLASPAPRVAYLRDVTHLATTASLANQLGAAVEVTTGEPGDEVDSAEDDDTGQDQADPAESAAADGADRGPAPSSGQVVSTRPGSGDRSGRADMEPGAGDVPEDDRAGAGEKTGAGPGTRRGERVGRWRSPGR